MLRVELETLIAGIGRVDVVDGPETLFHGGLVGAADGATGLQ